MASERERWVNHFELYLHVKNKPPEGLDLPAGLDVIISSGIVGTETAIVKDKRWIIQLADMSINQEKQIATLLFLGIDLERAEAVYGNVTTLTLRTAVKEPNEGGAVSAHMVINLKDGGGRHKAVLEEFEGLSRSRLVPFLQSIIGKSVQYHYKQPNGETVPVDSILTSSILLDKPISQQLEEAKLLSVELVNKSGKNKIDVKEQYVEKIRLIKFSPTNEARGNAAREIISKILSREKTSDYPEVRIRLEENTGVERSVRVNCEKHDALTSAFQRRTFIEGLDPPLEEATESIVPHMVAAMAKTLE